MQVKLSLSDIQVTQVPQHPNKMLWTGIVTRVGMPSDMAPCGTGGKLLIISEEAAKNAAPSMVNMPLNCEYNQWDYPEEALTGHNTDNIIGAVTSAEVVGNAFVCSGIIWKQNFPVVAYMINNAVESLGFSIEADVNAKTEDDIAVTATDITFTGLATLWKKCAAWQTTEFQQLVASRTKNTTEKDGNDGMNKEELQVIIDSMLASIDTKITEVKASVEATVAILETKVEASTAKANQQVEELAVNLAEAKEVIKASTAPIVEDPVVVAASIAAPAPTILAAGQIVVPNGDFGGAVKTKKERIAEVHAGTGTIQEKMRKVVAINAEVE